MFGEARRKGDLRRVDQALVRTIESHKASGRMSLPGVKLNASH